jgi:putative protease
MSGPAWDVELKGTFDPARPQGLSLLLPGLLRPVLGPDEYRLERTDGLPLAAGHPGVRAVLFCAHPGLRPGIFLR